MLDGWSVHASRGVVFPELGLPTSGFLGSEEGVSMLVVTGAAISSDADLVGTSESFESSLNGFGYLLFLWQRCRGGWHPQLDVLWLDWVMTFD